MKKTVFDGFVITKDDEYDRITIQETVLSNGVKIKDFSAKREFEKELFKMRDRLLIGSDVEKFNETYDAMLDEPAYMCAILCEGYEVHFFKNRNYIDIRFDEIWE